MSRIDPSRSLLVVVDVQEAFRPYESFERVAANCSKLLQAARVLGMRAVVSEQYPKGLGASAAELELHDEPVLEKTCFSAADADGFELREAECAVVCGIETHVCVEHTVASLHDRRVAAHVVADACGSRHACDHDLALERMRAAGAVIESVESTLFGCIDGAGTEQFKAVQRLVL